MIRVPPRCLCCGEQYDGGSAIPGDEMKVGYKVIYRCGASLSIAEDLGGGCYMLRFKNCLCSDCVPDQPT